MDWSIRMGWTGTSGNDVYYDYTGVNDMNGGDGNDQLYGLGGNDVFHVTGNVLSFPGFDYFNGGTGYNTITVDTSYTNIYLTSLAASDNINEIDGFANPPYGWDTRLELDYLAGYGSVLDLSNTSVISDISEIDGTPYADSIIGNGQAIQIKAGAGDDTLYQSSGSDEIDGGADSDTYYGTGMASNYVPAYDDGSGPTAFGTATSHIGLDGGTSLFGSAVNWISSS
jgi:Ca2+-binding RTX toxin-like protein